MRNVHVNDLAIFICVLFGVTHAAAGSAANHDKLLPCPASPNCVSSLSENKKHFIEPFDYPGSHEDARQKLIDILNSNRRVRLVTVETDFIHAEFRSLIFGFVDDVKFYFPANESIIHVRSASRPGYYDFGANRRRVERLRAAFINRVI